MHSVTLPSQGRGYAAFCGESSGRHFHGEKLGEALAILRDVGQPGP